MLYLSSTITIIIRVISTITLRDIERYVKSMSIFISTWTLRVSALPGKPPASGFHPFGALVEIVAGVAAARSAPCHSNRPQLLARHVPRLHPKP